ncbi:MAG TPA: cytochrome c peroxidase [Caulobacteraceae bacterium]|nr:cytochrome c peroxidase [Caulobacteraceae bacterium]
MFERLVVPICIAALVGGFGVASLADEAPTLAPDGGMRTLLAGFARPAAAAAGPAAGASPAAELGKALFFDPRLSGSGAMSCASCHNPALGWQDGRTTALGAHGKPLPRHTPTLVDVALVQPLFWDGRAETLEDQARLPLETASEMDMPEAQAVRRVSSIPGYRSLFAAAFPGQPVSIDAIARAIAAYERTIVSGSSPFDRWIAGDEGAVSESAKRGFALFAGKADCASCHSGWRFTDDGFHDIGLASADPGRARFVPGVVILQHAFKTPTLRGVADRGPYMHDGSVATLEAVVDHYDHGYLSRPSLAAQMKPLHLAPRDRTDLVAFLRALTGDDGQVVLPQLPR